MRLKFNLVNGCCFNLRSESIVATEVDDKTNTVYVHTCDGKEWGLRTNSQQLTATKINEYIWGKDIDCTRIFFHLV